MKTNEVLENIKARRSVRAYTGQQVLEEDLQAILEAATYAPSGMDCACAIENMFLAAQSLGIGSCWINQLGTTCDDPEVREFITALGVPANHKVYGCVALGYPDSKIPMKEKKVKVNTITIVR